MKITVDKTLPDLTSEELEEIRNGDIPDAADDPDAKAKVLSCKEVVFPLSQVIKQLEEIGMTPDEVVAMLLKKVGASQ